MRLGHNMASSAKIHLPSSIGSALAEFRRAFVMVGAFSVVMNILALTPIFYLMNVFGKAVSTASIPTLVSLASIALCCYAFLTVIDWYRSRLLISIASRLDVALSPKLYDLCFKSQAGMFGGPGAGYQPLSDLNGLRQFFGSPLIANIFDILLIPFFIILMLFFHSSLAVVAIFCMLGVTGIAFLNRYSTTRELEEINERGRSINTSTRRNLRNAEVAAAMGMMDPLKTIWRESQSQLILSQAAVSSKSSFYSAVVRTAGMLVQSTAITTGAVLVISQEISPGVMIGAALLIGKSLQPLQTTVNGWKTFVEAKDQYVRLNNLLATAPQERERMSLPSVKGRITVKNATVVPPGATLPTLTNLSFALLEGHTTIIVGNSGSGKSTLVRALLGVWPTFRGSIRLDGATIESYDRSDIGPAIGYLPQDIELLDGTVAENISRFYGLDSDLILKASQDAGIHEMILSLPEGYDTAVSSEGGAISPGQRQRIALARAVYGSPPLLIMDEPNSNLDEAGERALKKVILDRKSNGLSTIMVSHKHSAFELADYILIMGGGKIIDQGPREAVVARARQEKASNAKSQTASPITTVSVAPIKSVSGDDL